MDRSSMSFSTLQYSVAAATSQDMMSNAANSVLSLPPPANEALLTMPPTCSGEDGMVSVSCPRNMSYYYENGGRDNWFMPLQMDDDFMLKTSFPQRLGVSDMELPALPDCNVVGQLGCFAGGSYTSTNTSTTTTTTTYGTCFSAGDLNGEASSINGSATFAYVSPTSYHSPTESGAECWGAQNHSTPNKVGRYSVEERRDRILRYLKKRNQRNFNKTIKYACRKTLADKRIRVRGRFARNTEEDPEPNRNHIINTTADISDGNGGDQQVPFRSTYDNNNNFQIGEDEVDEEWLQDAMASLMRTMHYCVPSATGWHGGGATSG